MVVVMVFFLKKTSPEFNKNILNRDENNIIMYRRQSYYRRERFVRYLFLVVIKYVPWCVVFICVVIKCPLSSVPKTV
jgi:hypothetical protein